MKRSGFNRPQYQPAPAAPLRPLTRACLMPDARDRMTIALPKEAPARSEAYLRLVAALPCAHCGREGSSQAAHADSAGKGMSIKPSDFETMPLCASSPGRAGCHWLIGTSGLFSKEQRRHLERKYVDGTKSILLGSRHEAG